MNRDLFPDPQATIIQSVDLLINTTIVIKKSESYQKKGHRMMTMKVVSRPKMMTTWQAWRRECDLGIQHNRPNTCIIKKQRHKTPQ